jgi:integrase
MVAAECRKGAADEVRESLEEGDGGRPNNSRHWVMSRTTDVSGVPRAGLAALRHGCASFLLASGIPARAIMEVLGHSEIGVTMNTYAHVLPQLREEAADAIDELFGA